MCKCNLVLLYSYYSLTTLIRRLNLSIALVRNRLLCPVSLVIARALADNAFDPPIDSMETLLTRPLFENCQRVRLQWKDTIRNKPIFPISYAQFSALWLRTTLVAGYPERIRPYSMRVGAGNRLDGMCSGSLSQRADY